MTSKGRFIPSDKEILEKLKTIKETYGFTWTSLYSALIRAFEAYSTMTDETFVLLPEKRGSIKSVEGEVMIAPTRKRLKPYLGHWWLVKYEPNPNRFVVKIRRNYDWIAAVVARSEDKCIVADIRLIITSLKNFKTVAETIRTLLQSLIKALCANELKCKEITFDQELLQAMGIKPSPAMCIEG